MTALDWPEGYRPMWPNEVAPLLAELNAAELRDEEGEPFTAYNVDWAIQAAAEAWCDVEGVPRGGTMPDFDHGSKRWRELLPDVLARLGLDEEAVE